MLKRGRPKVEPERKRVIAHILPATHIKIKKAVNKNDQTMSSQGKVIDSKF